MTVLIVGFHRTGTSRLAALFFDHSKSNQEMLGATRFNALGHYEDLELIKRIDYIFESLNWTWRTVTPFDELSAQEISTLTNASQQLFDFLLENSDILVVKDPRLCILAPFASDAQWKNFVTVQTKRDPVRIVESLVNRNGGRMDEWFSLLATYNTYIEKVNCDFTVRYEKFESDVLALPINVEAQSGYRWIQLRRYFADAVRYARLILKGEMKFDFVKFVKFLSQGLYIIRR